MDQAPRIQKWNKTEWALARSRAIATLDPICAICHKYIDVELPMKDPISGVWNGLAVEVDHIVPRGRGGALYALDNLQLSHSVCNRRKGAKMDSDYEEQQVTNQVPWSNQW
jgi:5-methylcytosine-specific restriction endonuclease McrA